ncbi:LuxR C-terminal-related transcriptional regulator [Mycolicibacterium goodii]|uniref:LuxR C-terminal-related transcriptional regulator n=1 Tax=Mycolicibacterium goodii TaxID=134601 RepID=A0ABS6HYQ2_MYCGD|nr:LuxR C-terminal-related transcriptional regulator [Mycolicibacterium goodii]MBU8826582.1 LuxR C-terminal-related transcriptional regulator [Mycolicibacterium goodii]MBU8840048.1 LuxR C-terminal-related transcriptional regulator [Mycolicibacterium goodii]
MNASVGHSAGHSAGHSEACGETERAVLLATKLHIPAIAGELVHRTALLDALSNSGRSRLILLSAPVGWGKTTLLSQWALGSDRDRRFAWLSLDASDNDPVWFWMYVIAALRKISPGVGARAVELLTMGADPVQVVLPALLNDLGAVAHPIVLILDDYHMVVNRAVHEQVAFMVGRMPENLHMVLATRSDPPLPLARLRANGDLVEMRSADLRFGIAEADQLLNDILGLDLTEEDVHLLHRRTEGWAAALYLAALSLSGRVEAASFIRTFAGDNRHIVDYLMAEVLDCQPPQIRKFLLRTSVLRRFSGALCDAVLQSSDSASVLEDMERENLFLVPLDMSRHWYRYHHLFGELLRAELHRCEPEVVAGLHRRAAKWFESEGLVDEALRHLVAAGDVAESADLIVGDWVNEVNGGGLSTVSGWLDLLPEGTVTGDPRLSAIRAWVALNLGRFDDARMWIEAVEAGLADDTISHGGLGDQFVALREVYAFKTGDVATALEVARHATTLDFDEALQARSAAHVTYGAALYFSGSVDEARSALQQAVHLTERIGDRRHRVSALGYLGLIAAEAGELADAEHRIRQATGVGTDSTGSQHFIDVVVSVAVAVVCHLRGERASAADASQLAVGLARKGAGMLELAKALLVRSKILNDFGDRDTAAAHRSEAGEVLRRCANPPTVRAMIDGAGPALGMAVAVRHDGYTAAEELTPKELDVLRLLATRLSRRDIGQRLFVSLNTVKTHQRAIYRKLGVDNRTSAVDRGRELRLL